MAALNPDSVWLRTLAADLRSTPRTVFKPKLQAPNGANAVAVIFLTSDAANAAADRMDLIAAKLENA